MVNTASGLLGSRSLDQQPCDDTRSDGAHRWRSTLFGPRPQDHLRAAKQCDRFAVGVPADGRVPDLRGVAEMDGLGDARERSLARGTEKVALELDRCEALRALGQVRDAAVARCGVG